MLQFCTYRGTVLTCVGPSAYAGMLPRQHEESSFQILPLDGYIDRVINILLKLNNKLKRMIVRQDHSAFIRRESLASYIRSP
jgi:hypothetical protein